MFNAMAIQIASSSILAVIDPGRLGIGTESGNTQGLTGDIRKSQKVYKMWVFG